MFAARQPMPPASPSPHPILLTFSSFFFSCLPLTGGGLSWQRSAGESGTSYGGNQRQAHLPGEERESRGEGEELEANDSAHVPIVTFELFVL